VCTLAGRLDDALLHNEAITDKALRPCAKRTSTALFLPRPIGWTVFSSDGPFRPSAKVVGAKELPLRAKLVPTDERRRQIVKRPNWLSWGLSDTRSDHLKRVRRQT
jgi:hypothetical protein